MAFCDKCGAYIPDGQTGCLACGYDEAEKERIEQEQAAAAAAAAAAEEQAEKERDTGNYYSFSNEELREKLEEQRRKQQEASRKWAEQEKQRRQKAAEQGYTVHSGETFKSTTEKAKKTASSFAKNSKLLAALSYLGVLFVLPFLFNSKDSFSVYHAKQGAVLFLFSILSGILKSFPIVGAVLTLFKWFCIYKGMSNAINGIIQPLPYIGQLGEKF
ncbi:MAG: hypothetical protein IJZ91_08410 [Oscillospiraceae bacterium]|nr:hypothetical protein [Oscillospiraceae bacterium]